MLKWNNIDKSILNPGKKLTFKHSDNKVEYDFLAKNLLGLNVGCNLKDFKFELIVFGMLSECFFATQFSYNIDTVRSILKSGKAIPTSVAFENPTYRNELLNLLDKEDAQKPDLAMLTEFIKSKIRDFQALNGQDEAFWIAEWSDVNSWACYWRSGDKFNCLAKMSG